jgi:Ca2+-binding RTX toxin-like protein
MALGKILIGGDKNDILTGTALDDTISGLGGDDRINGGAGADRMIGGSGNDFYYVDNIGDTIEELAGGGFDTVSVYTNAHKGATIQLIGANNIEKLVLTGTLATGIVGSANGEELVGNAAKNEISGGAGDDTLDGGAGADLLKGGAQNDTYILDSKLDIVDEEGNADSGDRIVASFDVSLEDYTGIEHLKIVGAATKATGNDLANTIRGNDRANIIDGGGGDDTMQGGLGNDIYIVDRAGDRVQEQDKAGIDTVHSFANTYRLDDNVENLVLKGDAFLGIGNALNNVITGTDLTNQLSGDAGADTLIGGKESDVYLVDDIKDKVIEKAGAAEGNADLVFADKISYKLAANVENLTLTGGGAHNGTGNNLDNQIRGDDGDNILDGGTGKDVLTGGAGRDIYIIDNAADVIVEAESKDEDTVVFDPKIFGPFASTIEIAAFNADIEHVTLTGSKDMRIIADDQNNRLIGNSGTNVLEGMGGDDFLDGGKGMDRLIGGAGNDTYVLDNKADEVVEAGAASTNDRAIASFDLSLADEAYADIEHLTLVGAALKATGNAAVNFLQGNKSANIIDGGLGADKMSGFAGNDIYIVDNAGDAVTESANEGVDTVKSGVDFTLGANLENLTLTGEAEAGTGNALANILVGNDASNVLDGKDGADKMAGGKSDDIYIVDDIKDVVTEKAGEGDADRIQASLSNFTGKYSLAVNVEQLVFQTNSGGQVELVGNAASNIITASGNSRYRLLGGAGNDRLSGADQGDFLDGGTGADVMIGGKGDDAYVVDHAGDFILENASGGGNDGITASIDIDLEADNYLNVENVSLVGKAVRADGNAADNLLAGNALANTLVGEGGNDSLNGAAGADKLFGGTGNDLLDGGTGADRLAGGSGNDQYFVDNAGDKIIENIGEGRDTVTASVSFTLTDDVHVEDLILTGAAAKGIGNDQANTIVGTNNANTLDGADGDDFLIGLAGNDILLGGDGKDILEGGAGNDTMTGGTGDDTFAFQGGLTGRDTIKDFDRLNDVLRFEDIIDVNGDGEIDLGDLLENVASVVDKGAGKDVVVTFADGDQITFTGLGSGGFDSLTDLVGDASQIVIGA